MLSSPDTLRLLHTGGACGVRLIVGEMDKITRFQIVDGAVCLSYSANKLMERYAYNYSLSSYGQIVEKTGIFNLGMATNLREGKTLNSNPLNSV